MIEVSGVSKYFGEVTALNQVSFTVEKGQIIGFLGANGAGKTTTMDIICGCLGPNQGTVKICGFDITDNPIEAKRKIGYLPDEPPLHHDMKVREFVHYVAKIRGVNSSKITQRVQEVLEKLSLSPMADRIIGNLSKGYKQRVGLAQALVHNPEVLILDEPTEGLDPKQIVHIRELIKSLAGEHTILFSSHILSEVQSLCDELIIIDSGTIIEQGSYADILSKFDGGLSYELEVRQGASALASQLAQIEGLNILGDVKTESNTIEFSTSADGSVVDQVARQVIDGDFGLVQIAKKSASLEDVFFKLTR